MYAFDEEYKQRHLWRIAVDTGIEVAITRGDFSVLSERGRRALRIHLGKNVKGDLAKLGKAIKQALA